MQWVREHSGGGGLYITNSNASLANVSISDNQVICPNCGQGVRMEGGGINLINSTSLILNNCKPTKKHKKRIENRW